MLKLFDYECKPAIFFEQTIFTFTFVHTKELKFDGKSLGEVKIKRGIFQGDSLSPLFFIIALIPMSMILREEAYAYDFKSGVKLSHFLFMDELKLCAKDET